MRGPSEAAMATRDMRDSLRHIYEFVGLCIVRFRLLFNLNGSTRGRDLRNRHGIVQVEPAGRAVPEFVEYGVVGVDADLVRLRLKDHVTQP